MTLKRDGTQLVLYPYASCQDPWRTTAIPNDLILDVNAGPDRLSLEHPAAELAARAVDPLRRLRSSECLSSIWIPRSRPRCGGGPWPALVALLLVAAAAGAGARALTLQAGPQPPMVGGRLTLSHAYLDPATGGAVATLRLLLENDGRTT